MFKIGEATAKAIIEAPIGLVNLGDWMFTITSEEYAACAEGHQSAAQGTLPSGKRFSVNLEVVAGTFMVQHYIETVSERDHVVGFSPNTTFWLNDTDYVFAQVTWELKASMIDETSCELMCRALSETENEGFVNKLKAAAKDVPAEKSPLQKHIEEEAPLFAKDIERKALAGVWG
jgi:hypothetical protein